MLEQFYARLDSPIGVICAIASVLIILDILRSWVQRYRAWRAEKSLDEGFDEFMGLLKRSVEAEEKSNDVGEKLAGIGEKLIETRERPPAAQAPKFLH